MIPVQIPNLQDPELYEVLRKIALLSAQLSDIIVVGTPGNFPTSGKRKFFDDGEQLFYYTGNAARGNNGWIMIG